MVDMKGKGPRGPVAGVANESGSVCYDVNIPIGGTAKVGGMTTATATDKKADGTREESASASLGFEQERMMVTDGVPLKEGFKLCPMPSRGPVGDPSFGKGPKASDM